MEIHHLDGINWDLVYDFIYQQLLPDPSRLQILCSDCHAEMHEKEARDGCKAHRESEKAPERECNS